MAPELATSELILLSSLFFYSGLVVSFFSGVYPTAVGNSRNLSDSSAMIGLVGICIGSGGLFGGTFLMFGGKIVSKIKRLDILIVSLTIQFFVYGLTLANIPVVANIEGTENLPLLLPETNTAVVLLTGFLLGFSDAGIKYVIYTTISEIWRDDPAPVYALLNVRGC